MLNLEELTEGAAEEVNAPAGVDAQAVPVVVAHPALAVADAPSADPVPIPLEQLTLEQAFPWACQVEGCIAKSKHYTVAKRGVVLRDFGVVQNCTPRFQLEKQLTAHLKIHDPSRYYCARCNKYSSQINHKDVLRINCKRWDSKWSADPTIDETAEKLETNSEFSDSRQRLVIKVKVPRTR